MSDFKDTLHRIRVSRSDMMKRVARFDDLVGFDGGLPDSHMPGSERILCGHAIEANQMQPRTQNQCR